MSELKGRHFRGEIVLWAERWYCRHAVSFATEPLRARRTQCEHVRKEHEHSGPVVRR